LIFSKQPDGTFSGKSLFEGEFSSILPNGSTSMVTMYDIKQIQPDGSGGISFAIGHPKAEIRSQVKLSSDGLLLSGTSKAIFASTQNSHQSEYEWEARRMDGSPMTEK